MRGHHTVGYMGVPGVVGTTGEPQDLGPPGTSGLRPQLSGELWTEDNSSYYPIDSWTVVQGNLPINLQSGSKKLIVLQLSS